MTLPQDFQKQRFGRKRRGHDHLKPPSGIDSRVERELARRYHTDGDQTARDELIKRLMPLAQKLAQHYGEQGTALEELVQVATLGLVKAVDRCDPERGTPISSHAVPAILGELKRYRPTSWSLQVSRDMQERAIYVSRAAEALSNRLGRSPTPAEIAQRVGDSTERVLEALEASSAFDSVSFEADHEGKESGGEPLAYAAASGLTG